MGLNFLLEEITQSPMSSKHRNITKLASSYTTHLSGSRSVPKAINMSV